MLPGVADLQSAVELVVDGGAVDGLTVVQEAAHGHLAQGCAGQNGHETKRSKNPEYAAMHTLAFALFGPANRPGGNHHIATGVPLATWGNPPRKRYWKNF